MSVAGSQLNFGGGHDDEQQSPHVAAFWILFCTTEVIQPKLWLLAFSEYFAGAFIHLLL
jgi:hypothetical protein